MSSISSPAFNGRRYEIVAWSRGQEILFYQEFGSYSGEWILVSHKDATYFIWKGDYGSCSGCDHYEAEIKDTPDIEFAREFSKDYKPFLAIPAATMGNLALGGWERVGQVFPLNIRSDHEEIDWDGLFKDIVLIVKTKESLPVSASEIVDARNTELRQRALKLFGYERFIQESAAEVISETGGNRLLKVGNVRLLSLKDSSTERQYLLPVPDDMERVRQAIAWTFGLEESQYRPLIES